MKVGGGLEALERANRARLVLASPDRYHPPKATENADLCGVRPETRLSPDAATPGLQALHSDVDAAGAHAVESGAYGRQEWQRRFPAHDGGPTRSGRDCADPFVDDIIIGSGTENMTEDELIEAHEKDLRRVLRELDKHNMVCKPTKASLLVKEVKFACHVVGHGQRRPMPGKLASLHHWEKPQTISELRSFMGFCNYYSGYVRMYAELSGPLHKMLQVGKFDCWKGSKKKPAWTPEAEDAFTRLKERLLGQLGLFLVDPDKEFVLRTDASDYAVGAVLEQVRDDGSHVPVAFWSRILAEGQRRTWTARGKETYAIVCALRKWSGHIGLQPVVVCTDHQSLRSWHKEHVDTPLGPAARRARWHETFAKFDLSVVYVPGKDNTVADCLSRWAYPAGKAWMDISSHGDAEETEEAKRIIEMEKAMEQEGVKCFVVMANRTDLAKFRGARVEAIREGNPRAMDGGPCGASQVGAHRRLVG